jgi:hypothetical protein
MKKTRLAVAAVLAVVFGGAAPASSASWDCVQLTSGGGGTWFCTEGNDAYFVDCGGRFCIYHKM